jgi:hypothetical protein
MSVDSQKRLAGRSSGLLGWRRALFLAVAITAGVGSMGCSNVAAYQRGKLAHFTMRPSDASSVAQAHLYAIQEGATGGSVGAASGCGCN